MSPPLVPPPIIIYREIIKNVIITFKEIKSILDP